MYIVMCIYCQHRPPLEAARGQHWSPLLHVSNLIPELRLVCRNRDKEECCLFCLFTPLAQKFTCYHLKQKKKKDKRSDGTSSLTISSGLGNSVFPQSLYQNISKICYFRFGFTKFLEPRQTFLTTEGLAINTWTQIDHSGH